MVIKDNEMSGKVYCQVVLVLEPLGMFHWGLMLRQDQKEISR